MRHSVHTALCAACHVLDSFDAVCPTTTRWRCVRIRHVHRYKRAALVPRPPNFCKIVDDQKVRGAKAGRCEEIRAKQSQLRTRRSANDPLIRFRLLGRVGRLSPKIHLDLGQTISARFDFRNLTSKIADFVVRIK